MVQGIEACYLFGPSPIIFCIWPDMQAPLKPKATTMMTIPSQLSGGEVRYEVMIIPRAGSRPDTATFTWIHLGENLTLGRYLLHVEAREAAGGDQPVRGGAAGLAVQEAAQLRRRGH